MALLLFAPLITGCASGSVGDMFSSDLLSKDAEWFSRTGRLSIQNVSIETPPLTPNKPVTAEDLVSADGLCPGMTPPAGPSDANALTEGAAGSPPPPAVTGTVALGHTECDVVRGIGAPGSVNISNNPRGDRLAVVTYTQGPRPGIYTFTGGRLTSVERGEEPAAAPKPKTAKSKVKKKPAAT
ncbi:hypothetical protein [Bradyrhizobium canariense]|uniref:hypothetical protein n=1 Tax=Bradyrhizobium canariense TaxID=255045 RepID=UPI0011BAA0FA|nr:hypothetical protein [Bradyrhizobium canariense]